MQTSFHTLYVSSGYENHTIVYTFCECVHFKYSYLFVFIPFVTVIGLLFEVKWAKPSKEQKMNINFIHLFNWVGFDSILLITIITTTTTMTIYLKIKATRK